MAEVDRLHAQVLAEPTAIAPRLVYADALLEAGDPRGELIQLQCTLDELDRRDPSYAALDERADDLLAHHETAWTRDLRGATGLVDNVFQLSWRRGFVERARLDTASLPRTLPLLRARTPLRALTVQCHTQAELAALGDAHDLFAIEELAFAIGKHVGSREISHAFAGWPHADGVLRDLVLTGGHAAHAIAAHPELHGLRNLHLTGLHETDVGQLRAPHLAKLRELWIGNSRLDADSVDTLASFPTLELLQLERTQIDAALLPDLFARLGGVRELRLRGTKLVGERAARAIGALAELRTIDLESTALEAAHLSALFAAPQLQAIDLSDNRFGALGLPPRFPPTLERLVCRNADLDAGALAAFAGCPDLARLQYLDVGQQSIGDDGLAALASSPHLTALDTLVIDRTAHTRRGLAILGASDLAPRLRKLELANTELDDDWLLDLLAGGRLDRLEHLVVGDTCTSADACRALVASPVAGRLKTLHLAETEAGALEILLAAQLPQLRSLVARDFDDRAASALEHARGLPMLRHLSLTAPALTDTGAARLATAAGLDRIYWMELHAPGVSTQGTAALQARFAHHLLVSSVGTLYPFAALARRV